MGAVGKTVAAAVVAAVAWLTLNLGNAWWLLLGLLALDLILNWQDETQYLQRLLAYAGSTAAALYVQHGLGVDTVRLVMIALVAWEAARIGDRLVSAYAAWRQRHHSGGPTAAEVHSAVARLEAEVEALAARVRPEAAATLAGGPKSE